jgi:hypothetical protein
MSKLAQLRALRETQFEERQARVTPKPKAALLTEAKPLLTAPITAIAKKPERRGKTNAERQVKWRETNTDLNRKRAREGMRKKRAASNDAA